MCSRQPGRGCIWCIRRGLHWGARRVKNDERDATEIAQRLRRNDLPEAWIAPPKVRELRELVRFRAKLVALRSGLKAQVHAVLAKQGVLPRLDDIFGPEGQRFLDEMSLDDGYAMRVESLRDLIEFYDREIAMVEPEIHRWLRDDAGYRAIQAIHGVGRTMAAIFVAEIGDVYRFPTARHLCSWAGLTPKHIESDTKVFRGRITRMGSALVRGRHRSRGPLPRWARHRSRLPAHRGAARHQDRPRRRRPQGSHPRLLRHARWPHPLPRGGRVTVRHSPGTSSTNGVIPPRWRGRRSG
jgi:transposase